MIHFLSTVFEELSFDPSPRLYISPVPYYRKGQPIFHLDYACPKYQIRKKIGISFHYMICDIMAIFEEVLFDPYSNVALGPKGIFVEGLLDPSY